MASRDLLETEDGARTEDESTAEIGLGSNRRCPDRWAVAGDRIVYRTDVS